MSERILPLDNRLEALRRGERITIVQAESEASEPRFVEAEFGELMDGPEMPLAMVVEHGVGVSGVIPFAGSSVGIESIIVGEGEGAQVIFHNSNVLFPFLPPFKHSVFTLRGEYENVKRKADLGLGSADKIRRALNY